MSKTLRMLLLGLTLSGAAAAQDEGPGVSTSADLPAVSSSPSTAASEPAASVEADGGTATPASTRPLTPRAARRRAAPHRERA